MISVFITDPEVLLKVTRHDFQLIEMAKKKEPKFFNKLPVSVASAAARVDPPHHPLAGEPRGGADHAFNAAETGGFP